MNISQYLSDRQIVEEYWGIRAAQTGEWGEYIISKIFVQSVCMCLCVRLCMCACLCMCEWMRVCIFWHENPISPGILRFTFMIASEVKGA